MSLKTTYTKFCKSKIVSGTKQVTKLICMSLVASLALTEPAAAQGFADFLNNILNEVLAIRRPIALIALLFVGFAFLFNIVDLRRASWVAIGVIIIFGVTEILDLIIA